MPNTKNSVKIVPLTDIVNETDDAESSLLDSELKYVIINAVEYFDLALKRGDVVFKLLDYIAKNNYGKKIILCNIDNKSHEALANGSDAKQALEMGGVSYTRSKLEEVLKDPERYAA